MIDELLYEVRIVVPALDVEVTVSSADKATVDRIADTVEQARADQLGFRRRPRLSPRASRLAPKLFEFLAAHVGFDRMFSQALVVPPTGPTS